MENNNNVLSGKIIILSGYAGSGKDFYSEKIEDFYFNNKNNLAFADKFKEIMAKHIPTKFNDMFPDKTNLEILNSLKNDHLEIPVYDGLNMRKLMQKLLGDTIRGIHKDIHCAYTMSDYLNKVNNDPNTIFVCTDNRYENEQDYLININLLNNINDRKNFVLSQIKNITQEITVNRISEKFENDFPSSVYLPEDERQFFENIKFDFFKSIKELKSLPDPEKQMPLVDFSNCDFNEFDENYLGQLGLFRIFRKAVSDDFYFSNVNENEIIDHIQEYSALSQKDAELIVERYKFWDLPLEDLKKYGICRTNPTLPSERELVDKGRSGIIIENIGGEGLLGVELKVKSILEKIEKPVSHNPKCDNNQTNKKRIAP